MSAKMRLEFDGLDAYLEELEKVEGAAQAAVDEALKAMQALVADKCAAAMVPHRGTGRTAASIVRDGSVEWTGDTAAAGAGFKISEGWLPSIFLMHGTKSASGKQLIQQDKQLYDAVYGKETQAEAVELQKAAFEKAIAEVMKHGD